MKCPQCGSDLIIQVGAKINCKSCKVLTGLTSIVTVQCDKCNHVFQVPVSSNSFFSVKKDD